MMPNPVRLFHITAIDNLAAICERGAIISKNTGAAQGISYQNIAHSGAQGARAVKAAPNPPGGTLHDFVPFYFAPRSPMLSAIHNGNVRDCIFSQDQIIHFETTVDRVVATNNQIVFYDRNATKPYSTPHTDLSLLTTEIAWDLITETPKLDGYCKYFFDRPQNERYIARMEHRQAEFIVKHKVDLNCITRIGVCNEKAATQVCVILGRYNVNLVVEIKTDWYFLGQ